MLNCDLCGNAKDVQTWTFGLDGKEYEIDLCPEDGKDLSKVAIGFGSKARKVTAGQSRRRNSRKPRPGTAAAGDRARATGRSASGQARAAGSQQKAGASGPGQQAARTSRAKAKAAASRKAAKDGSPGQRAARAGDAQQHKGIFVYAILPADIQVAEQVPGVGERPGPLRVVCADGVAALISEVDLSGRLGSPGDRRTHSEILDATATEVPVLPLRFGTVLASEDQVIRELLAAHHDEFAAALQRFEGRAQFLVKGRYLEPADPARRKQDTRALEQAMKEICVASVMREPDQELDAVHAAFLVDANRESELEQAIEDLARDWEGRIEVQLLGPMAAYDFVTTAAPGLAQTPGRASGSRA